ncbi:pre-mRNA-splicing ATP-dependent RNA helicase prp28-like isoform X2 [Colletes gigas]|uniref:pre-mRNA-splicing ATP-dependent RNA helicase prp28-like isoform X2 n=1 Tax=Colletes gigas TaxID=935657 RepID=UPI001C9A45C6|nr:pre-mRNA-splicing ATP-dependent RNA helicase prp28-like isoform X2 [Colletes gigas]
MQLAATQRPHPPPVPPRPSRQVVAEALKRSPRPPCPTRQAPPPPNTKPWRSDQEPPNQQQVPPPVPGGRTVVYESIKEPSSGKETGNETVEHARVVDRDRRAARNASERNEDEDDRRGNPRERRHQRGVDQEQRENSAESSEKCSSSAQESVAHGQTPRSLENPADDGGSRKLEVSGNARESKEQNVNSGHRSLAAPCNDENGKDDESTAKPVVHPRLNVSFGDLAPIVDSKLSRLHSVDKGVEKGRRIEGRPTPAQRSCLSKNREKRTAEESSVNENGKFVSSVDRATVVVMDEPERKAASNDDEDNQNAIENENDNIHRQDWLDAGVHYSSTQITLSGDDGDPVDGDRVNGLDHCENEKVGDLNFLSLQERIAMSSLQGLPPLPRSLSGFNLSGGREGCEPPPPPTRSSSKTQRGGKTSIQSSSRPSPPARQLTTLDTQLAILRREMFRQSDPLPWGHVSAWVNCRSR